MSLQPVRETARGRDLTGSTFGRLKVVGPGLHRLVGGKLRTTWDCVCSCGNQKTVKRDDLVQGKTSSCGCLGIESRITHGQHAHPMFDTWEGMLARCHDPRRDNFANYGGRGITVCDEWRYDPVVFFAWLAANGWCRGLQIDRRDNDRGYSPDNCRVVDARTNLNNRSNNVIVEIDGCSMTIGEAATAFCLNYSTIMERFRRGWTGSDLVKPARSYAKGR